MRPSFLRLADSVIRKRIRVVFVCAAALLVCHDAAAQLPAFPGAEGAGRLTTGGRGGDVYHVINLNDNGAGSLRQGILDATAAGRTIVFDVAGTINLTSSLDISSKSKITIAGQTAPAGGITIANQRLQIKDSNNIVVQHIRVRPGSTYGNTDPDAIWVNHSTDVMIDHVTASWGVDETISVTHDSNNVTVQWSTMIQGLFNAGHSGDDGVGHSYGSLLNGGNYSFHHNLYAHSKSRHPRAQKENDLTMQLDWVNNVMFNPGDQFGNSDSNDPYSFNMVGNYGIKGPQSGNSLNWLMDANDVDSQFYISGNYMDMDRDLVLDGAAATETQVMRPGRVWGTLGTPAPLPPVTTLPAPEAYIQVMSRAGANNYRDSIDRRTIRTVMNHLPGHIDTQANWGGWPTLPIGSAPTDSNGDGVSDDWAVANGFNVSTPLHQTFAPDGYTYLEKYIHSLTPNAYTPVGTVQHTISTAFGDGADAYVTENGGASAVSGGNGVGSTLDAVWGGSGGTTNQAVAMRFDLSEIVPGSLTAARLDLTAASAINDTHDFMIYGLVQDAAGWDWNESSVAFSTAPGLSFDGNSQTLGINNTFTTTNHPDNPNVLNLGQVTVGAAAAGDVISLTNPNLAVFLNLAAYYQGEASENVVTIILQQVNNASPASFWSKEGNAALAPQLVIDAVMAAVPILAGDYNDDGIVDAGDYIVWRKSLAGGGFLANETASPGVIDELDYDAWMTNFGSTAVGNGGGQAPQVPEPATLALVFLAGACGSSVRRRLRVFGCFLQE
jgi:hypothetical protein